MSVIPESPILGLKVHIALRIIGSECTFRNCDGKQLTAYWKARLKFRELLRDWKDGCIETS